MDPVSDGVLGAWAIAELEGGADFATIFSRFESSTHFWQEVRSAIGAGTEISNEAGRWIDGMHELMDGPFTPAAERSIYQKFASGPWGQLARAIRPYAARAAGAAAAIHEGVEGLEHMFGDHPTTPGNTQPPYNPTPTTPGGIVPDNVIEMFGHNSNGHSLLPAQSMGFRDSQYGGALSGRSRFRSSYPANQTRRQTEQFGDLNGHSRIYQFYNYHGEKKQMLDEYARGLVLSLVRIQKGVVHDYDEPIAWPYPVHQPEADVSGAPVQTQALDQYLNWIEFHFKDARRDGGFYGKTLGNRFGTEGYTGVNTSGTPANEESLAKQYQYDVQISNDHSTCVPLWKYDGAGKVMLSLTELAKNIADMFEKFAYLGADMTRAHQNADPTLASPHIDTLDVRPCRIMLVKSLHVPVDGVGRVTHDVVYDDEQFASSRVDIGSYTTVTLHNVSPASGDIVGVNNPMSADTITHVPLVGKMYTFSGSCPKVWDKHKADLHALFNPLFFRLGRYRLPESKLDDLKQFKTPPRGRAIWSNCIGESKIVIGPGMIKKLRMNFRIRDSLGEFWQKYRDHYLSDSRLGRTVCICLEPMLRREHVGEPIPVVLQKNFEAAELDSTQNLNATANTLAPFSGSTAPNVETLVEYQPYELIMYPDPTTGLVKRTKQLRPMFNFGIAPAGQDNFVMYGSNPQQAPAYQSQGIYYWWYDTNVTPRVLVKGNIVHPSQKPLGPANAVHPLGVPHDICLPIDASGNLIAPGGHWRLAMWTDDPERCSKGDPMMFNIQINRMLHASTRLKKFIALGADKTGVKRNWDDRLIANLGSNMFTGTAYDGEGPDAPRDIDMFNHAGIKEIVLEGESGNLSVTTGGGSGPALTQQEMEAAMTAALTAHRTSSDYHPLSTAVHTTGTHAGKIDFGSHPLAIGGVTARTIPININQYDGAFVSSRGIPIRTGYGPVTGNVIPLVVEGDATGTALKVTETNPVATGITGTVDVNIKEYDGTFVSSAGIPIRTGVGPVSGNFLPLRVEDQHATQTGTVDVNIKEYAGLALNQPPVGSHQGDGIPIVNAFNTVIGTTPHSLGLKEGTITVMENPDWYLQPPNNINHQSGQNAQFTIKDEITGNAYTGYIIDPNASSSSPALLQNNQAAEDLVRGKILVRIPNHSSPNVNSYTEHPTGTLVTSILWQIKEIQADLSLPPVLDVNLPTGSTSGVLLENPSPGSNTWYAVWSIRRDDGVVTHNNRVKDMNVEPGYTNSLVGHRVHKGSSYLWNVERTST